MTPMKDTHSKLSSQLLAVDAVKADQIQLKMDLSANELPPAIEKALADMELMVRQNQMKKNATEHNNLQAPELASQFLSRFGLRGPQDIKAFLKSPAGETVKEELGHELALEESERERRLFETREKEKRKHRIIALLLLYLSAKSSHAKELRDYITEEIEKHLQEVKQKLKEDSQVKPTESGTKDKYIETSKYLEQQIEASEKELGQVENQLQALEENMAIMDSQHQQTLEQLAQTESQVDDILGHKAVNELTHGEKKQAAQKLADLIKDISTEPKSLKPTVPLRAQLEQQRKTFIQQIAYRTQHLHALHSVLSGSHKMCDHHFNEVHHPSKAHLFMPEDKILQMKQAKKQVTEHDGQFYLVKQGQNVKELSPENRQEAKQAYKNQLAPEKHARQLHYCRLQHAEQRAPQLIQLNQLKTQQFKLFKKRIKLNNQLCQLQAARAAKKINPNVSPSNSSSSLSGNNVTSSYKAVLDGIKSNPSVEDLTQLQQSYKNTAVEKKVFKLKPGKPIPKETFKKMMCTQLPDEMVKSTLNKLAQLHPDSIAQKAREHDPTSSLTPFNTKPDAFKK